MLKSFSLLCRVPSRTGLSIPFCREECGKYFCRNERYVAVVEFINKLFVQFQALGS